MPEQIRDVPPPKGFSRLFYRLPIYIYRVRLGRLMGSRFLLLEHTGRKSGKIRRNVLEVVRWDESAHTFYVVSAWGEKADWLQNVRENSAVTINIGGTRYSATAIPQSREISDVSFSIMHSGTRVQPVNCRDCWATVSTEHRKISHLWLIR